MTVARGAEYPLQLLLAMRMRGTRYRRHRHLVTGDRPDRRAVRRAPHARPGGGNWARPRRADPTRVGRRILIIAGFAGKTGAAHLAALGALRSGAGLVTVVTARRRSDLAPRWAPSTLRSRSTNTGRDHRLRVGRPGPRDQGRRHCRRSGIGQDPSPPRSRRCSSSVQVCRAILDADALNAFGEEPSGSPGWYGVDVIITPHPGDMARLVGRTVEEVHKDRLNVALTSPPRTSCTSCSRATARSSLGEENRAFDPHGELVPRPAAPATCSPG